MGLFDGLFGGGGSSQTTTTDAYKNMPEFLRTMLEEQAKAQTSAVKDAGAVRLDLANPNSVAPLNAVENAGLRAVTNEQALIDRIAGRGDAATAGVTRNVQKIGNIDPTTAVNRGSMTVEQALRAGQHLTRDATVQPGMDAAQAVAGGVSGDMGAARGIDIGSYEAGYENPYLDDVVNTTLSRFDEDLIRRQMANESAAAAIGGITNTRRAVADAVDQQLTTREKGAAEAGLRADAFDTSRRMALERGDFETGRALGVGQLGLDQAGVLGDLALNEGRFGLDRAEQYGAQGAERGKTMAELALENARFGVAREGAAGELALGQGQTLTDQANARSSRAVTEGAYLQNYGEKLRGLDQARLDAPKDALSWFSTVSSSPNAPVSTSQSVTNAGGNSWAQMVGAGLGAYQVLSDERAKTDIDDMAPAEAMVFVRGMRPSTYEYRHGMGHVEGRTAGLMAQDLEGIPGAVSEGADGYKRVDPYPVLATLAAAVQDLDRRIG